MRSINDEVYSPQAVYISGIFDIPFVKPIKRSNLVNRIQDWNLIRFGQIEYSLNIS